MKKLSEQLKEYLDKATPEQLAEDAKMLEKYNGIGPTVEEYFRGLGWRESGITDRQFEEAVEYYASQCIDYLFHTKNRGKVIIENIFKKANNHVRIADYDLLDNRRYNDWKVLCAIDNFLDRKDTKLDIILVSEPNWDDVKMSELPNIYRLLLSSAAFDEGRVRIACGDGKSFKLYGVGEIFYCVADGYMYYLLRDKNTSYATSNFNDIKDSLLIEKSFDVHMNDSVRIINEKIKEMLL